MSDGERLFARFAFAPNDLGYCGPAESATLFDVAATGRAADVTAVARGFSGAWPYLSLLADMAGVGDPLDARVVRAYWTGGPLLDRVDRHEFAVRLIESLGATAGHYWRHLSSELLPEATATHGFHVFGVYPWSRLLGPAPEKALDVLDNCRIRWGEVITVEPDHVVVRSRRLSWDGARLSLAPPGPERVRLSRQGRGFVTGPLPGQWLALHWDWVCDRLTALERDELADRTAWQLDATNARLERANKGAA